MGSVQLPPPYKGENDRIPLAELQEPFAQIVDNFALDTGVPTVRNGSQLFCAGSGSNNDFCRCMAKYGNTSQFEVYQSIIGPPVNIVDVTSGTPSVVRTVAGGMITKATSLFFNNYLYIFGDGALSPASTGPQYYDGTTWGNSTYSWPANFTPFGGNVFKNRAYFIGLDSSTYAYSDVGAVAASSPTLVDLSSVLSVKANLLGICSLALSRTLDISSAAVNVQVFVFDSGEVLYYTGLYPDDDSWTLIGRFTIPRPNSYNSFVAVHADYYVITECGPVSLTELFQQGVEVATQQGISVLILNRWQQIANAGGTVIGVAYDSRRDRLVIGFDSYIKRPGQTYPASTSSTYFFLIYSFRNGAWFEYFGTMKSSGAGNALAVAAMQYFGTQVYFVAGRQAPVFSLETSSDFVDIDLSSLSVPYNFNLVTAPISSPKFGANQITGVEILMQSDLYGTTYFDFIADLGRVTTGQQLIEDQGTSMAKPMANVGISDAAFAQLQVYGTTATGKSVGLNLNAFNVWYQSGAAGSR